ncbi:MAG: glycosyltransferase family 2 protein, partial [bacterium JZ-2024 1]
NPEENLERPSCKDGFGSFMAQTSPLISFIVVNHNARSILGKCLSALLHQTVTDYEILVVDNASSDGSADWIAQNYPQVRLITSKVNLGYAGGINLALTHAQGKYIFVLNPDIAPPPEWAQKLYQAMASQTEISCFSCSIANVDLITGEIHKERKGGTVNLLGTTIPECFSDPEMTFYPSGAAFCFPASEKISLNTDFFLYYEDVFLGWLLRLQGKKIKKIPDVTVLHFTSFSARKKPSSFLTYHQERNRLLVLFFLFPFPLLVKIFPLLLVDLAFRWFSALLGRKSLSGIFLAHLSLLFSPRYIWKKRKMYSSLHGKVEKLCIPLLSGHLLPFPSLWNTFSLAYCRLLRIPVYEVAGKDHPLW